MNVCTSTTNKYVKAGVKLNSKEHVRGFTVSQFLVTTNVIINTNCYQVGRDINC